MIASLAGLAAAAWVALLVTTPLLPSSAAALLYGLGSLVCHQIPERSFYVAGFQLPVCARCVGIYAGGAAGAALVLIRVARTTRMTSTLSRRLAIVAALPTIITVSLEMTGLWFPSNLTRAVAGLPLGAIAGVIVANALAAGFPPRTPPPHLTGARGGGPTPLPFDSLPGRPDPSTSSGSSRA